jgi:hypothetical protein
MRATISRTRASKSVSRRRARGRFQRAQDARRGRDEGAAHGLRRGLFRRRGDAEPGAIPPAGVAEPRQDEAGISEGIPRLVGSRAGLKREPAEAPHARRRQIAERRVLDPGKQSVGKAADLLAAACPRRRQRRRGADGRERRPFRRTPQHAALVRRGVEDRLEGRERRGEAHDRHGAAGACRLERRADEVEWILGWLVKRRRDG